VPAAGDLFALTGDVAVVTGGASGLGLAVAGGLAALGARVAILDANLARAEAVASELGALAVGVDVTDRAAVGRAYEEVGAAIGRPTMLVNSAGIGGWGETLEYPEELWRQVLDVNLTGTLNTCLAFARMACGEQPSGGEGAIVNIASTMGLIGFPGLIGYAASKGGVIQVTRALAVELAPRGLRVNAVAPSTFDTPLALGNRPKRPQSYQRLLDRTPAGRFGQTDEIVGPVVFLLSRGASMVTGHVLAVDGGYLAG
jgi:NAD(P)-dependent dehydrogenase (short-subunit alcohol dehydrogenase family)